MIRAATAVVVAAGWPAGAVAGPIYYHRAGVARDAFVADFTECDGLAGGVDTPAQPQVYAPNAYAAGAAAFFRGFFGSAERRRMTDNVLRTCMADKGYRRVEAPDALARDLRNLGEAARLDRLFALAAADRPQGKLLPR